MDMTQSKLQSKVITTACGQCYVGCGIKVQVENGVVVNVEGNPDNPQNRGVMCAKGKAGFMNLYNPNRVKVPLKRTNPKKGMHEDPGWKEISWDEAIDTIVAQLERIRDTPKKLWVQAWEFVGDNVFWLVSFGSAFGTNQILAAGSATCGKVVHPVEFFAGGGFHQQPDMHYANYCILIGTQFGVAARGSFNHHLTDMADARARGMKLVVIDPVGGYAASKANEWIPILPGTDAALGLSHAAGAAERAGHLRCAVPEDQDQRRLTWSAPTGAMCAIPRPGSPRSTTRPIVRSRPTMIRSVRDPAITGSFDVQGKPGRPAFELLREHVTKYSPEATEKITTIPAATVRRIAREFGRGGAHRRDHHHRWGRASVSARLRGLGQRNPGPQARFPQLLAAQAAEHRGRIGERARRHDEHRRRRQVSA